MSADLALVQADPDVRAIVKQATDVRTMARECIVDDAQGYEWATAPLGEIATARRSGETRRIFFVKPLNDQAKAINELFRTLDAPLAEADRTLRQKALAYREAERRRALEEQTRLRAEAAAKEAAARAALTTPGTAPEAVKTALDAADAALDAVDLVPAPLAPTVRTPLGSATARTVWDFELVDKSKVPGDYLVIDVPVVRAAIRAGVREIPGLRIFGREDLAVKPS